MIRGTTSRPYCDLEAHDEPRWVASSVLQVLLLVLNSIEWAHTADSNVPCPRPYLCDARQASWIVREEEPGLLHRVSYNTVAKSQVSLVYLVRGKCPLSHGVARSSFSKFWMASSSTLAQPDIE